MSLKLVAKKKDAVTEIKLRLDIPNGPQGTIVLVAFQKDKKELKAIRARDLEDEELLPELIQELRGFTDDEGKPITGQDSIDVCLNGDWSSYLVNAVVMRYYEHFNEAGAKNARR